MAGLPTTGVTSAPARVSVAATTPPMPPQPMTAIRMAGRVVASAVRINTNTYANVVRAPTMQRCGKFGGRLAADFATALATAATVAMVAGVVAAGAGCSPLQDPIKHGPVGGNAGSSGTGGGSDSNGSGTGGNGSDVDLASFDPGDGGTAYAGDFAVDTMCVPPQMATQCPNPIAANAGCKGV